MKSSKTSNPLEKIAADANVILSAVIGKTALRLFTESSIEIVTTQFNLEEVKEYIPHLASKYGLPEEILQLQLKLLPLKVFTRKFYQVFLREAKALIGEKDPEDIDLLALALKLNIPIWSNDKDFQGLKIKAYPTARILKILGI